MSMVLPLDKTECRGASYHGYPARPTKVTQIQPSSSQTPENTLRFYLYFAQPMKPNVAFNYIKLVNAAGEEDNAAFMKFKQELWSADRKRLTLLMDQVGSSAASRLTSN